MRSSASMPGPRSCRGQSPGGAGGACLAAPGTAVAPARVHLPARGCLVPPGLDPRTAPLPIAAMEQSGQDSPLVSLAVAAAAVPRVGDASAGLWTIAAIWKLPEATLPSQAPAPEALVLVQAAPWAHGGSRLLGAGPASCATSCSCKRHVGTGQVCALPLRPKAEAVVSFPSAFP